MTWTRDQVRRIYHRSGGCCAYCRKRLSIHNYGRHGERGAWHVDHRRSRFNGGSDHGNNLAVACIACNLDKGTSNARSYQRAYAVPDSAADAALGIVVGVGLLTLLARARRGGVP